MLSSPVKTQLKPHIFTAGGHSLPEETKTLEILDQMSISTWGENLNLRNIFLFCAKTLRIPLGETEMRDGDWILNISRGRRHLSKKEKRYVCRTATYYFPYVVLCIHSTFFYTTPMEYFNSLAFYLTREICQGRFVKFLDWSKKMI